MSATQGSSRTWTRRQMFGLTAGAVSAAALAGCGSGKKGADIGSNKNLTIPDYVAPKKLEGAVVNDNPLVQTAYEKIPQPPYQSVTEKPGDGTQTLSRFDMIWATPTTVGDSKVWQELNKELGVTLKVNAVPSSDYGAKLQTVVGGGDMPDMVFVEPLNRGAAVQKLVTQGVFMDLSPYLSGDKVKDYPNIGTVPAYAWQNSAVGDRIYGVPNARAEVVGGTFCYRHDWATKSGNDSLPKNADDFMTWAGELAKAGGKNVYAEGSANNASLWCQEMCRVPNQWRLNKDGTLTADVETDEMEEAYKLMATMHQKGLVSPDALDMDKNLTQYYDKWEHGSFLLLQTGLDSICTASYTLTQNVPDADPQALLPIGHDGGQGTINQDPGYYGYVAIPADRAKDKQKVELMLRVLNYECAPFGSAEWMLLNYGIEGLQYTWGSDGTITTTKDSKVWGQNYIGSYIHLGILSIYYPNSWKYAQVEQKTTADAIPYLVKNPVLGLYNAAALKNESTLNNMAKDYLNGVVMGRRPATDIKQWREDWKKQGGDDIRKEYEATLNGGATPSAS